MQKEIYIWGAGHYGVLTALDLENNGVKANSFIDTNANQIKNRLGLPVFEPNETLSEKREILQIIIAVQKEESINEIKKILKSFGLKENINFKVSTLIEQNIKAKEISEILIEFKNDIITKKSHRNFAEVELKNRLDDTLYLERFGFKVYSQNDEDGIIEEIFNRIGTTNKSFIEFGVQNGLESNGHFLLHKGWNGLWIEGSENYTNEIKKLFKKCIDNRKLTLINAFITKNNINSLIAEQGKIQGEIDLLSIDIDGNDYWIWEAIKCIAPRVVVIEYNAKFPPNFEWVMEYNPEHIWHGADEHGASLKSLELLGKKLGYHLVGTNTNGVNAFFVKTELAKNLFVKSGKAEKLYNPKRWQIEYRSGHPSKNYIGK